MKKFNLLVCAVLSLSLVASSAQAAITNVSAAQVDQAVVANTVVNDILVDFTGNLRTQQMILTLDSGSIYQDMFGSNLAPNQLFIGSFPSLAYDTFVTIGGATTQTSVPTSGGDLAAVNIDAAAQLKFDDAGLNVAWFPSAGNNVADQNGYMTARISLSSDAAGTVLYWGSTQGEDTSTIQVMEGTIANGMVSFGGTVDPIAQADPASGSSISLQGVFNDGSDLLSGAIKFTNGAPTSDPALMITGVEFTSNDEDIFTAAIDGLNIDLGINGANARTGQPRDVSATLVVSTNDPQNPTFNYTLTARVPEPSTFALAGLALVGFVGFARRK